MGEDYPDILEADKDGEYHPGDQKALASLQGPHHEKACTDHTKEGIKNSVLDERPNTDIPTLALVTK